jgi:predicted nucleic-acid-binding protein
MIGLDTNILVRYLTQDDPKQSRIANDIIERRLSANQPGFVSVIVTAETAWVLQSNFKASQQEVAAAIEGLISQSSLVFEHVEQVVQATEDVKRAHADFADAVIAYVGQKAGCSTTLTFDVGASKQPGFDLAK